MLIMPSFKKSLIVEQFQGNYLKQKLDPIIFIINFSLTWITWVPAPTLKQKSPLASTEVDIDLVAIEAPSVCRITLRPFNWQCV